MSDDREIVPDRPGNGERAGRIGGRSARLGRRIAVLLLLVWVAHGLIGWTMAESQALKGGEIPALWVLVLLLVAYALLIALPFVPGVELGLTLLMVEGGWIAPFIWGATLAGLMLSFLVGLALPYPALRRTLADLRLCRAAELVAQIEPLDREARLDHLRSHLPGWLAPLARNYRYLLLALLINLPGNSVIGGGGGILMVAGCSRLFAAPVTLLTVALAVAPVPILVFALGEGLPLPGF
ncbi:hypothetical protein [Defluviimonas salinarum]|uniref:TVP38/TMEM64 family membrane protein n=1 Tax=Defluviimonas salinarum TaxID=2992147 RepID=A0ABT3J646_9RHOB|nr:hypothetical protein [Defluviimonas salinarum]MCW3783171.1 hypothetical protein [Defluviimonas salinarum]